MTLLTLLKPTVLCCAILPSIAAAQTPKYPPLPEPVSNNSVAKVSVDGKDILLSFMGLGKGKDHTDVHNKAWALALGNKANTKLKWQQISPVPHINALAGRLASVAVGVKDTAYLFGGFTVAADHSEISTQDNYRYNIKTDTYQRIADMPVAVDDAALVKYRDRYIYLLGGWHQHGNVNLVQVYDIHTNSWSQASPIPAPAVFGQSAGIVGNELVLCDGVTVEARVNQARTFSASPVCLYGKIKDGNHLRIDWQSLTHYSATHHTNARSDKSMAQTKAVARYRMASTGIASTGQILFLGGSDNPYNYNGIGYDGQPSKASNQLHRFDVNRHQWLAPISIDEASMDHRGLIEYQSQVLTIGGMLNNQEISDKVATHPTPIAESQVKKSKEE